jgi:hypothetical protein
MTDRDYVTYRDPRPAPYPNTAAQWNAVKDRAVVPRDIVRDRMRHGWALEPALTTPKESKRPVGVRIRELAQRCPGITGDALRRALPDVGRTVVANAVRRDVAAGRIRTVKVPNPNPHGWRMVLGYVLVAETAQPPRTGRSHSDDTWTPGAWVHPIRARMLGLPVATRRSA